MGMAASHSEFAEVLVGRHNHPTLVKCHLRNRLVSGIRRPCSDRGDVMAFEAKRLDRASPHAGVEQQFHADAFNNGGATRSRATTRHAYTRQA